MTKDGEEPRLLDPGGVHLPLARATAMVLEPGNTSKMAWAAGPGLHSHINCGPGKPLNCPPGWTERNERRMKEMKIIASGKDGKDPVVVDLATARLIPGAHLPGWCYDCGCRITEYTGAEILCDDCVSTV